MEDNFLSDIVRVKQWCKLARDDAKRAKNKKKCSVYIQAIQAIEAVELDLKKEIKNAPKPAARD